MFLATFSTYDQGYVTKTDILNPKQLIFAEISEAQKLFARPNWFWELGSRVPPLCPLSNQALLSVYVTILKILEGNVHRDWIVLRMNAFICTLQIILKIYRTRVITMSSKPNCFEAVLLWVSSCYCYCCPTKLVKQTQNLCKSCVSWLKANISFRFYVFITFITLTS